MSEDNQAVIKALNMYGRVPEMWELLEEIERLNKENEELKKIQCTFLGTGCKAEIERLNNIINEFESWLISWIENEQYCFMANNPKDRCRREIYEEVLHHFKELKGVDKE